MGDFFNTGSYGDGIRYNASGSPPPAPPPAPAAPKIDPPIDSDIISSAQLAFGFDQLSATSTGNTVHVKRLSDNATSGFGFLTDGTFDFASVYAWAGWTLSGGVWTGGSDVVMVDFIDQLGSGKLLAAQSTVYLIQSGLITKFGTDWNSTTGAITFSNTNGGCGVNIAGGNYFELTGSGIVCTSGLEVHMMASTIDRKIAANNTTDVMNGNNTAENYFSYGTGTTKYFTYEAGGGNFVNNITLNLTGASGTNQSATTSSVKVKANSMQILTARADATNISQYSYEQQLLNATPSAGNITALQSFSNGTLRIGRRYPGVTNEGTVTGKMLFGGVIITNTLTDFQRSKIHWRLMRNAWQHLMLSITALLAMFDEIIDFRNKNTLATLGITNGAGLDTSTGLVKGINGLLSLQFNLNTDYGGYSPDWTLENTQAPNGLVGLASNDYNNLANTFNATTNYFADINTGTVITLGFRSAAGTVALGQWWSLGTGVPPTSQNYDNKQSLAMGWHHSQPDFYNRIHTNLDPHDVTNHGYGNQGNNIGGWGDNDGGEVSQSMLKYYFNLAHGDWDDQNSITNISQANPGVVTANMQGMVNGFNVTLNGVGGMTQVNGNSYTVAGKTSGSFQLSGIDTSGFSAYTSGGWFFKPNSANVTLSDGTLITAGTPMSTAFIASKCSVVPPTPENAQHTGADLKFNLDRGILEFHAATFQKGASYDPTQSEVNRRPYMRTGTNWSYVAPLGQPIGHYDCGIASQVGNGNCVHSDPASTIQSNFYLSGVQGTRNLFGFIKSALTMTQIQQIQVNLYRLFTDGYMDPDNLPPDYFLTEAGAHFTLEDLSGSLTEEK